MPYLSQAAPSGAVKPGPRAYRVGLRATLWEAISDNIASLFCSVHFRELAYFRGAALLRSPLTYNFVAAIQVAEYIAPCELMSIRWIWAGQPCSSCFGEKGRGLAGLFTRWLPF